MARSGSRAHAWSQCRLKHRQVQVTPTREEERRRGPKGDRMEQTWRERESKLWLESSCRGEAGIIAGVDIRLNVSSELKGLDLLGMLAASNKHFFCPEQKGSLLEGLWVLRASTGGWRTMIGP